MLQMIQKPLLDQPFCFFCKLTEDLLSMDRVSKLCIAVYCGVLLCIVVYCCLLLYIVVACCVLLCIVVSCCVLLCIFVYCCLCEGTEDKVVVSLLLM